MVREGSNTAVDGKQGRGRHLGSDGYGGGSSSRGPTSTRDVYGGSNGGVLQSRPQPPPTTWARARARARVRVRISTALTTRRRLMSAACDGAGGESRQPQSLPSPSRLRCGRPCSQ
eukprot:scaffold35545_cov58-Phaeocystis_antarctica.AAC.3